ncbi:MAG: regulatory protein RecX [Clostridia bacterium]|nr:regulatory protein RecX [Clostridia bacterium]
MAEITNIKPAKRGGRMLLTLSDGTYLRVTKETVIEQSLKAGQTLSDDDIASLRAHGGIRADESAAMILGRRMCSVSELREKLAERGYTDEEIDEAIERLSEYGFVDDAAYAAALVERGAAKNQSKKALLYELSRRGIDRETAQAALENLPSADDALDELIRARLKGVVPDRALTEKTYRYLAGKGFAPGEIRAALRRYTHGSDFDD